MTNLNRDIMTEAIKIEDFVDRLAKDKFLIPTFQREFVWRPENIKRLWDSIYRFYPIGSILYWITEDYLHTHRRLGGFNFPHDDDTVRKFKEWQYILDGQQRATSLLVSMKGGTEKIKGQDFDYTLYFDARDGSFIFADELEKRSDSSFIVRLKDVPDWSFSYYKEISNKEGFNEEIERNLNQISKVFADYKISLIMIKGVEVEEVCEIFERINQEGKKLDPVDIVVAKTFRNEDSERGIKGFYLREKLGEIRSALSLQGGRYQDIPDLTLIQMISICLRKSETSTRKRFGITPRSLYNIQTDDLESDWLDFETAIFETVKLLSDMRIHGNEMLPFGYLVHPLCHHMYRNKKPNKPMAKQWFWSTSFGIEDLRTGDQVYQYCSLLDRLEAGEDAQLPEIRISKKKLIDTSYYYRGGLSRAVMAFLAKQDPLDFEDPDAEVLDNVYLLLTQAPNLHHIYPRNFLAKNGPKDVSPDSLMNICFLRAKTNIHIGDKNPLEYFREFESPGFERILQSHLIPRQVLEPKDFAMEDYRRFLEARASLFCERLVEELPDVKVTIEG